MSLILFSGIAAGTMFYATKRLMARPPPKEEDNLIARRFMHTGTYGATSQISEMLHEPGMVIGEKIDQDLTGMPKRWLFLKNGAAYETYDMHTQYVK